MSKKIHISSFLPLCLSITLQSCAAVFARKAGLESKGGGLAGIIWNPWYWAQLGALGMQAAFWLGALRHIPLSTAYPCMSLVLLLNLAGAHWIFHEEVAFSQWAAILLIITGVTLVLYGATEPAKEREEAA